MSTRSNANEDARRDFDGFNVDEELRYLREALQHGHWRVAAELVANIDESLSRGGALPVAWLGPVCMQEASDLSHRLEETQKVAAWMSPEQRRHIVNGYVALPPATATMSWKELDELDDHLDDETEWSTQDDFYDAWSPRLNDRIQRLIDTARGGVFEKTRREISCHQSDCAETLALHGSDAKKLSEALQQAAVLLGWRRYKGALWCGTHVVAKQLACARCSLPCPMCSCMGGPLLDATEGDHDGD